MNRASARFAVIILSFAAVTGFVGCSSSNTAKTPTPSAAAPTAPPTAAPWSENVPEVTFDATGQPTITLPPGVPAPTELMLTVLKEGTGPVVQSGDKVVVDYQGVSWDTGEVFDQSYGKSPATFPTTGVIPGFQAALVGQKVGSQVLVVIPPELAYGKSGGSQLSGQTLVFLIDIKETKQ